MSSANNSGEAEFPFDKQTVFAALLRAIPKVEGMSVHSSDQLSGRVIVKSGMSLFSWGEHIPISLKEPTPNRTLVRIFSAPKTGVSTGGILTDDGFFASGDMSFGKNRKNVDLIFSKLSAELSKIAPPPEVQKKKCPFCAELIQAEAIKCRFCGSDLKERAVIPEQKPVSPIADFQTPQTTGSQTQQTARIEGGEVHFECCTCNQPLAVDAGAAGQEFSCPECGEHLVVPSL